MERPESNFTFGPSSGYGLKRADYRGWWRLIGRIAVLVLATIFGAMLLRPAHAGTVRSAVVNDPASARAQDVKPLIRDDLETYLDGGRSVLGWNMLRVTPTQLVVDFRANEVAASRQYLGGPDLVITGTVRLVTVTLNTPRIELGGVSAFMRTSDDWLASLKPGQRVTVVCRRARQVIGMVGAYDCERRATYVQRMTDAYFYSMHGLAQGGDKMAAKLLEIASR
jgi:hypothetical protein